MYARRFGSSPHERKETRREGEGNVYSDQQTRVIEAKPVVKIQLPSPSPGITTGPRSVVQVLIPDDGSTGSGGVTVTVSILSGDEEVNEGGDEEPGHALHSISEYTLNILSSCTLNILSYPDTPLSEIYFHELF